MTRDEIINFLIEKNGYKKYLEIGVNDPYVNYYKIRCEEKESIDPYYEVGDLSDDYKSMITYRMTSDEAFNVMPHFKTFDVIFIDGLHLYEQVEKDLINAFKHLSTNGVILIHDSFPKTKEETCRDESLCDRWSGDVYKTICNLKNVTNDFVTIMPQGDNEEEEGICVINYFDGCRDVKKIVTENVAYEKFAESYKDLINPINVDDFVSKILQEKDDVEIYEMGHKPWDFKKRRPFFQLQLGASSEIYDICDLKDNSGDNISRMNRMYGELTGTYWIWKNRTDGAAKYIGQCLYSRIFMTFEEFDYSKIFENYDVILPNKIYLDLPNKAFYESWHNYEDYQEMMNIIREKYPEYIETMNMFNSSNELYTGSCFIMKKEDFIECCNFVFGVLFEWQARMGISKQEDMDERVLDCVNRGVYHTFGKDEAFTCLLYQRRALGFLGERILNIYFKYKFSKPFIIPFVNDPYGL